MEMENIKFSWWYDIWPREASQKQCAYLWQEYKYLFARKSIEQVV